MDDPRHRGGDKKCAKDIGFGISPEANEEITSCQTGRSEKRSAPANDRPASPISCPQRQPRSHRKGNSPRPFVHAKNFERSSRRPIRQRSLAQSHLPIAMRNSPVLPPLPDHFPPCLKHPR